MLKEFNKMFKSYKVPIGTCQSIRFFTNAEYTGKTEL